MMYNTLQYLASSDIARICDLTAWYWTGQFTESSYFLFTCGWRTMDDNSYWYIHDYKLLN